MPSIPLAQTAPQEQRPSPNEWNYEFVSGITKGVDKSKGGRSLEREGLTEAVNVRILKDALVVSLGYEKFTDGTILGKPRLSWELFQRSGSAILTLLTNTTFYSWNASLEEFEYIAGAGSTTLSANEAMGQTVLSVTDETGFSGGDLVGIQLNDGTQHRTTVASTAAGTITVDDALPSAADSGNAVVRPLHLNGSDDIQPSATTWAGTDKAYYTNGVDPPFWYDGLTAENISGLPTGFVCRIIEVHVNHLIVLNTTENGSAFPQRERWSEPGDDTSWNTSVNFVDHVDTEDRISGVEHLGVYMIIYKERAIIRQEFIGTPAQNWNWVSVITGEGTLGEDQIVNLGDRHIFWGNANVYDYRGGFDLRPIGDMIFDGVFSASEGDLSPEKAGRTFGVYVEELDEIWFFYVRGTEEFPMRAARYNVSYDAWTFRDFNFEVSGYGFFAAAQGITWAQAEGTWEQAVGPWISAALQAGAPTILLLDGTNNTVYETTFLSSSDDGTAISFEVMTKDFFMPNRELRFDRYDMRMKGNSVLLEASLDGGNSFVTIGTVSPGTAFTRVRQYKQLVGRSIRFRFTGQNGFGLEEMGFTYKLESIQP